MVVRKKSCWMVAAAMLSTAACNVITGIGSYHPNDDFYGADAATYSPETTTATAPSDAASDDGAPDAAADSRGDEDSREDDADAVSSTDTDASTTIDADAAPLDCIRVAEGTTCVRTTDCCTGYCKRTTTNTCSLADAGTSMMVARCIGTKCLWICDDLPC